MKKTPALLSVLVATLLLSTGCATRTAAGGAKEVTVLGGLVTTTAKSFQPVNPTTTDVDTTKLIGRGNPTGRQTSILWGLITLTDY